MTDHSGALYVEMDKHPVPSDAPSTDVQQRSRRGVIGTVVLGDATASTMTSVTTRAASIYEGNIADVTGEAWAAVARARETYAASRDASRLHDSFAVAQRAAILKNFKRWYAIHRAAKP
jgi:hypothetical protein